MQLHKLNSWLLQTRVSKMRSQINPVFIIVAIFFILIALPRDPNSYLGRVSQAIDSGFSFLLGTEMGKCPFLRRGMLISAFNEVPYQMLVGDKIKTVHIFESTLIRVPTDSGEVTCELDDFINFDIHPEGKTEQQLWSEVLKNDATRRGESAKPDSGPCEDITLSCTELDGPCQCIDSATGKLENCALGRFVVEELLAPEAQSERELFSLMGADIPPYICFLIFGILPFIFIYYFMQDILSFTMLQPGTARVIAAAVGIISVYTGGFIGVTVGLVKFMKVATGFGTLIILLGVGFASAFFLLLAENIKTGSESFKTYKKLKYGIKLLKSMGAEMVSKEES